ncbi:MAG: hypothetical protein ABI564_18525 [Ideonella sp.]
MRRLYACWLLPATIALATANASAQAQSQAAPGSRIGNLSAADPLDATTEVAPLMYRSALGSFRRVDDADPVPWREANDRVGRIGGWRAYAREANEPAVIESPTPAAKPAVEAPALPSSKPMPGPHGGHTMH